MKDLVTKGYPYSVFLLFFFPLLKENLSSFVFILFGILTLYNWYSNPNKEAFNIKWIVYTIPFWIVVLDAILYGTLKESSSSINHALLFLLFPFIFNLAPSNLFSKEKLKLYFTTLSWVCFVLGLSYLFLFFINNPLSNLIETRYNSSFFRDFVYAETEIFNIHPAYYTSVMIFCTAFNLIEYKKNKKKIHIIFICFFYFLTFLLLTKLNIVLLNLVITYFIFFKLNLTIVKKLVLIFLIFIVFCFLIYKIPGLYLRIAEVFNSIDTPPSGVSHDSTNVRMAIYTCDWELIKNNFWQGVGFYDIPNQLLQCFEGKYHSDFYKNHKYLTHNYFVYVLLGSGIVGLLFLLIFFYKVIRIVVRINSFVLYVFLLNTILMCLIEDYFYRQNGIYFFMIVFLSYYKNLELSKKSAL